MTNKEQIALDSKAVEVLKEAVGGGGSQGGASPYVLSYFDVTKAALNKSIDVEALITALTKIYPEFPTLEFDTASTLNLISSTGDTHYIDLLTIQMDSDNHLEVIIDGDHFAHPDGSTTKVVDILRETKTDIEDVVLSHFTSSAFTDINWTGVVMLSGDTVMEPYPYEDFISIFKEPVTSSQEI